MADSDSPESRLLAKLVIVAAIVLLIVGLIWHGVNCAARGSTSDG